MRALILTDMCLNPGWEQGGMRERERERLCVCDRSIRWIASSGYIIPFTDRRADEKQQLAIDHWTWKWTDCELTTMTTPQSISQSSSSTDNNNSRSLSDENLISTLRVAQSELVSGNTSGKVFVRLSNGSAPLLTSRPRAQDVVTSRLRKELLKDQP